MKLTDYLDSYRGLMHERTFSRIVTLGMLLITLVLSVALMQKKPILTLIPPNLTEGGELSQNDASSSIKKAWALTAANLVGNVSPGNVEFVESALEGLLSPRLYHSMLEDIHAQARSIQQGNITLSFSASDVYYQKSSGLTFVTGTMTRGSRFGSPENSKRTFEFLIKVENYRPVIAEWDAYDGNPALRKGSSSDKQKGGHELSEEELFFMRAQTEKRDVSEARSENNNTEAAAEPPASPQGNEAVMDSKLKEIF